MGYRRDQHRLRPRKHRPGGFTIVELLITMAMIILLLSILTVAIASATRTSQSANTRALMNSIKQALARFKADVGYYPPVLGTTNPNPPAPNDVRNLLTPPDPTSGSYRGDIQEWFSFTALADYLIGYGHHEQDGYGVVPNNPPIRDWDQEVPALGIRHPGRDGAWGATHNGGATGGVGDRMRNGLIRGSEFAPFPIDQGKVYGPYLELKDERLMAFTDGTISSDGKLDVYFPGERLYNPDDPMVIVDYWGRPIRFYRRPYPLGALQSVYRDPSGRALTLSDVFLLRPFEIKPGAEVDSVFDDVGGDPSTSYPLRSADVALFSPGPDRSFNAGVRRDEPSQFNADNIVELGP